MIQVTITMDPIIPIIRLHLAVEDMHINTGVRLLRHRRALLLHVMLFGLIMVSYPLGTLPG